MEGTHTDPPVRRASGSTAASRPEQDSRRPGARSGGARPSGVRGGVRSAAASGHFRRLKGWDYSQGASFFITVALEERRPLFGHVEAGSMHLSPLGEEVLASLEAIPRFHPEITLYGHVVMPDHVHFNCHLAAGLKEPLRVLGRAIAGFKAATTRLPQAQCACGSTPASEPAPREPATEQTQSSPSATFPQAQCACGSTAKPEAEQAQRSPGMRSGGARPPGVRWRAGYHDHLCLSRRFIDSTERYIAYNPLKWELMHGAGGLRILEPLSSPRLDPEEYWKGVGNPALLSAEGRLVSLRVSRKVRDIAAVVARMEAAADQGYTVISGFASKGEQAVRDALCRKPGARLIHLRASCIPNARFRPESAYVQAFAEDRCLELGRGNEEIAFDRAACLDVNEEIVRIATSGPGLALYFTENGLVRLG